MFGIMFEAGLLIAALRISALVTNLLKQKQKDLYKFVDSFVGLSFLANYEF